MRKFRTSPQVFKEIELTGNGLSSKIMAKVVNNLVGCLEARFSTTAAENRVNEAATILDFKSWPITNSEGRKSGSSDLLSLD